MFKKDNKSDKIYCYLCGIELDPETDIIRQISISNSSGNRSESGCTKCAETIKYDYDDYHYSSIIEDAPELNKEENENH